VTPNADPTKIESTYNALLVGEPDARRQLIEAAAPLAEILTDQHIGGRRYAQEHRDDLIGYGHKKIVECVDYLAQSETRYDNAHLYICKVLRSELIKRGIELATPCGIGPGASTVLAERRKAKNQRDVLLQMIRETMGNMRPCNYCEPPHNTDRWTHVWRGKTVVAYACTTAWHRDKLWQPQRHPTIRQMRATVLSLYDDNLPDIADDVSAPAHDFNEEIISLCEKKRERDILELRLKGIETAAIAEKIGCKERTVQLAVKNFRERYLPWHDYLYGRRRTTETEAAMALSA